MEAVSRRMVDVIIWYVQRFNNPYLLKILFIENAKKYSGIPLIPPPMGQKKFGCYNEVTVLKRVSLQENVCRAAKKSSRNDEVTVLPS